MEGTSLSGGLEIGISCFTGPHLGTGGQKHTHTHYGPTQGARGGVWRRDGWMVRLFRGQNKTASENREEHDALALGGHHLAATHNNQPIVGKSGRGDVGEEARGG
jgi:hypothetical protein